MELINICSWKTILTNVGVRVISLIHFGWNTSDLLKYMQRLGVTPAPIPKSTYGFIISTPPGHNHHSASTQNVVEKDYLVAEKGNHGH